MTSKLISQTPIFIDIPSKPTGLILPMSIGNSYVDNFKGSVVSCAIIDRGYGYTSKPSITFEGGNGNGAAADAIIAGNIVSLSGYESFSGYRAPPNIISEGNGFDVQGICEMTGCISEVDVACGGTGYEMPPEIIINGDGSGAVLKPIMAGYLYTTIITNPGYYPSGFIPTISFNAPATNIKKSAIASGVMSPPDKFNMCKLQDINIQNGGLYYDIMPSITISSSSASGSVVATASGVFNCGISGIEIISPGSGYSKDPTITVKRQYPDYPQKSYYYYTMDSFTPTPTTTSSPTVSYSPTNSPTVSFTPTSTVTRSLSKTPIPTLSLSNTPSVTKTSTGIIHNIANSTPTPTPSKTVTKTPTFSPTNTMTLSQTPTITCTPTYSATNTRTPTYSATSTCTTTLSPTYSPTSSLTPSRNKENPFTPIVKFDAKLIPRMNYGIKNIKIIESGRYRTSPTIYIEPAKTAENKAEIMSNGSGFISMPTIHNFGSIYQTPFRNAVEPNTFYPVLNFKIVSVDIINGGSKYTSPPRIELYGGYDPIRGKKAILNANLNNGIVNNISITDGGDMYLTAPEIRIYNNDSIGDGLQIRVNLKASIDSIFIEDIGYNLTENSPNNRLIVQGGGGVDIKAKINIYTDIVPKKQISHEISYRIIGLNITSGGDDYHYPPKVIINGGNPKTLNGIEPKSAIIQSRIVGNTYINNNTNTLTRLNSYNKVFDTPIPLDPASPSCGYQGPIAPPPLTEVEIQTLLMKRLNDIGKGYAAWEISSHFQRPMNPIAPSVPNPIIEYIVGRKYFSNNNFSLPVCLDLCGVSVSTKSVIPQDAHKTKLIDNEFYIPYIINNLQDMRAKVGVRKPIFSDFSNIPFNVHAASAATYPSINVNAPKAQITGSGEIVGFNQVQSTYRNSAGIFFAPNGPDSRNVRDLDGPPFDLGGTNDLNNPLGGVGSGIFSTMMGYFDELPKLIIKDDIGYGKIDINNDTTDKCVKIMMASYSYFEIGLDNIVRTRIRNPSDIGFDDNYKLISANNVVYSGSSFYTDFSLGDSVTNQTFSTRACLFCESAGIPTSWNNPPTFNVSISSGKVSNVSVDDGGKGFFRNTLIRFNGGGGYGALAVAHISGSQISDNSFTHVTILRSGEGYVSPPEPVIIDTSPTWKSYECNYVVDNFPVPGLTSVPPRYVKVMTDVGNQNNSLFAIFQPDLTNIKYYEFTSFWPGYPIQNIEWHSCSFIYKNFKPEEIFLEPEEERTGIVNVPWISRYNGQALTTDGIYYSRGWLGNVPARSGSIVGYNVTASGRNYSYPQLFLEGGKSYTDSTLIPPMSFGCNSGDYYRIDLGQSGIITRIEAIGGYNGKGYKEAPTVKIIDTSGVLIGAPPPSGDGAAAEAIIGIEQQAGIPKYAGGDVTSIEHVIHYHYHSGVVTVGNLSDFIGGFLYTDWPAQMMTAECEPFINPNLFFQNSEYITNFNGTLVSSMKKWKYLEGGGVTPY
jgi:hypothetical protein